MNFDYTDFYQVRNLVKDSPSIKILTRSRDNTALILSFSFLAFKVKNVSRYLQSDLISALSNFLYGKNFDTQKLPREYLDDWVEQGFYRKFTNPSNSDEYFYDITPDTENTLRWLQELNKTEWTGQESRLLNVFTILKEMATRSSEDKEKRKEQLREEIKAKELEIEKIDNGEIEVWDSTKIRETFQLLEETIRRLLSDFRQVEENFRQIDAKLREEIIATSLSKGKFLDTLFQTMDKQIWDKAQGRSFKAFFDFLIDQNRQDELDKLINIVLELPDIQSVKSNNYLVDLKYNLIDNSNDIHRINDSIIRSLRRFIESSFFMRNRQIMKRIEDVLELAMVVKPRPPSGRNFMQIDGKAVYNFVMSKKLFEIPSITNIKAQTLQEGENEGNIAVLYEQEFIDIEVLRRNLDAMLRLQSQVSFKQLVEHFPIEKGLAEVVAYLNLAKESEYQEKAKIDEMIPEAIEYQHNEQLQEIILPQIIFIK